MELIIIIAGFQGVTGLISQNQKIKMHTTLIKLNQILIVEIDDFPYFVIQVSVRKRIQDI